MTDDAFPDAPLNPGAAPWARAVERRITAAEKQAADVAQRLAQAQRVINAIKSRDIDGAMNYQGEFVQGGTTTGGTVYYSGHWMFDLAAPLPVGWRMEGKWAFGGSTWPAGQQYNHIHTLDDKALILTAFPGKNAALEFDITEGKQGAVWIWLTFELFPDQSGVDATDPYAVSFLVYETDGSGVEHVRTYNQRASDRWWTTDTAPTAQTPLVINGIASHRFRFELQVNDQSAHSVYIDAIELAVADDYQTALNRLYYTALAPDKTVIVPPVTTPGATYHAGDTVSSGGTLWTALTDTDGSAPVEGPMWTSLSGDNTAAYEYAGAWTP